MLVLGAGVGERAARLFDGAAAAAAVPPPPRAPCNRQFRQIGKIKGAVTHGHYEISRITEVLLNTIYKQPTHSFYNKQEIRQMHNIDL